MPRSSKMLLSTEREWPSTLLHGQISASRTVLFFRIITISMFTLSSGPQHIVTLRLPAFFPAAEHYGLSVGRSFLHALCS